MKVDNYMVSMDAKHTNLQVTWNHHIGLPPPPFFLSFVISTNSIIPLLTLLNGLTILHDVQESAD